MALRNAVRDSRVAHAYLFSGPRGTGKTSTARILAKALNCVDPDGGEPCGVCQSCTDIADGRSLDVHELDAASNNGVEAMRDLVSRAALGTPGRWKVYIVDEVHMLSAAAANALLKTLEEPPAHVVFVLATTDPQKVLATIRSRTQHFEFHLLKAEVLRGLLEGICADGGLAAPEGGVERAVRQARGSARDALSVLDQVLAAGRLDEPGAGLEEIADALGTRDIGRVLSLLAVTLASGQDPARIATDLAEYLRQGFLATVAPELVELDPAGVVRAAGLAKQMGLAALVRGMEVLGRAQIEMRDALEPRLQLEVALTRLASPEADDSTAALLERLERLERAVRSFGDVAQGSSPGSRSAQPDPPAPSVQARGAPSSGPEPSPLPGSALGAYRSKPKIPTDTKPEPAAISMGATEQVGLGSGELEGAQQVAAGTVVPSFPSRDDLVAAWGDTVLAALGPRARARFRAGRFVGAADGVAVFALPNPVHLSYCEPMRREVEQALSDHFSARISLRLVVEGDQVIEGEQSGEGDALPESSLGAETDLPQGADFGDRSSLEVPPAPEERLMQAFPGAREVDR